MTAVGRARGRSWGVLPMVTGRDAAYLRNNKTSRHTGRAR
ncbi:hypothetical protein JOE53_000083 [Microbacterium laevaniformans]|uniref:Uncharacterized protein n=1 Tax=Microbacterium laevaniformans TaxID=36807 RepID=A0A150HIT3_9MICO|nr:hypothetical protein Mlaev_00091 [Microbacterium laevaniformans]MBM7751363.1 hypothetical protein [Microbacterium laevaniformans]